jgi:hypothetical protein
LALAVVITGGRGRPSGRWQDTSLFLNVSQHFPLFLGIFQCFLLLFSISHYFSLFSNIFLILLNFVNTYIILPNTYITHFNTYTISSYHYTHFLYTLSTIIPQRSYSNPCIDDHSLIAIYTFILYLLITFPIRHISF